MDPIYSHSNSKIKLARSLRQRKARQETGLFLVEGIRHVGEAVEAGAELEFVCYAEDLLKSAFARELLQTLAARQVPCYPVTPAVLDALADKDNPQGILAVARQHQADLADLHPGNFSWGVASVAPQDPGNIGTILRTIDAAGASGLLLLDGGVDPYHPAAVRASMGSLFWHPVASASFVGFAAWARQHKYYIYGTSAHGSLDYRDVSAYHRPAILLLGSEREGLTPEQASQCQALIRLPMRGRATSLNLAVAAGIMLYEMIKD